MSAILDMPRVLELEGGLNVRDLGGYRTEDGRTVKWRTLFRSGSPAQLTEADRAQLAGFGIRALCDLRTTAERDTAPSTWVAGDRFTYWARECETTFGELRGLFTSSAPDAQAARAAMVAGYRRLPFEQGPGFREIFRRLKGGEVPIMWNCAAGKDRAGTAAALILTALGVPRETVIEDYLISNQTLQRGRLITDRAGGRATWGRLPEAVRNVVLGCDAAYLDAAFAAIDERCGSFPAYLADILDVREAEHTELKARLLD